MEALPTEIWGEEIMSSHLGYRAHSRAMVRLSMTCHQFLSIFMSYCKRLKLEPIDRRQRRKGRLLPLPDRWPTGLTSLYIYRDWTITHETAAKLPRDLLHLDLDSRGIRNLGTLANLPPGLQSLKMDLHSSKLPKGAIAAFPRELKSLCITKAQRMTDIQLLPPSLRALDLPDNYHVNDFAALPRGLTRLNMSSHQTLCDADVADLPRTLLYLNLRNNVEITDSGTENLPPLLQYLDLSHNDNITGRCVRHLPRSLVHLGLAVTEELTDDDLGCMPVGLTHLDSNGSRNITDRGIAALPRGLKSLRVFGTFTPAVVALLPRTLTYLDMPWPVAVRRGHMRDLPPGLDVPFWVTDEAPSASYSSDDSVATSDTDGGGSLDGSDDEEEHDEGSENAWEEDWVVT